MSNIYNGDGDELLTGLSLRREPIFLDEVNQTLLVRELTAAEVDEMDSYGVKFGKKGGVNVDSKGKRAFVVHMATINEDGARIFSNWKKLAEAPSSLVNKLYNKIAELSGISDDIEEEIEGN